MKTNLILNIAFAAALSGSCTKQDSVSAQPQLQESSPTTQPIAYSQLTNTQLIITLQKQGKYQQILDYAKKSGINTKATAETPDTTLALFAELGYGHKPRFVKYTKNINPIDTAKVRQTLINIAEGKAVETEISKIEPSLPAYSQLKQHYARLAENNQVDSMKRIAEAMNAYRWINRQAKGAEKIVLVNTRGAYLKGMDSTGNEQVKMRVIVGKKTTPTPSMDTYATGIVKYPHWNVPRSIATQEILPKVQRNIEYLYRNNFEVIDSKGNIVDPYGIDWFSYSATNLPYRFRQNTGLDNSLGVVKVDIKNPYSIYLHDTNARKLFEQESRWKSHGCVRVQKPAELANFIAGKELIEHDITSQPVYAEQPQSNKLEQNVPVFILYLGADVDETGQVKFYEDIYNWDK